MLLASQEYPADPLLHACIVCASVSCPDVALTAYKPETLQSDMEANMRHFLANPKKGLALDKACGVVTLSKVRKQRATVMAVELLLLYYCSSADLFYNCEDDDCEA